MDLSDRNCCYCFNTMVLLGPGLEVSRRDCCHRDTRSYTILHRQISIQITVYWIKDDCN